MMIDAVALGLKVSFLAIIAGCGVSWLMSIVMKDDGTAKPEGLAKPRVQELDESVRSAKEDVLNWTPPSQRGVQSTDLTTWAKGPPDVPSGKHHPELWKCPDDAWPVFRDADRHPWIEMGEGKFAFWETLHHETMHGAFTAGRRRPKKVPWEEGLKA